MLWLRLVVVAGFVVFVGWQGMWLIAGIGVILAIITGFQLYQAYQEP